MCGVVMFVSYWKSRNPMNQIDLRATTEHPASTTYTDAPRYSENIWTILHNPSVSNDTKYRENALHISSAILSNAASIRHNGRRVTSIASMSGQTNLANEVRTLVLFGSLESGR